MPISEPITVTREMECSDWPGLDHMFKLVSGVGSAPPKLHELSIKNSLNKIGAQFLKEGMNARTKRGVLNLPVYETLVSYFWSQVPGNIICCSHTGLVLGQGTLAALDGR